MSPVPGRYVTEYVPAGDVVTILALPAAGVVPPDDEEPPPPHPASRSVMKMLKMMYIFIVVNAERMIAISSLVR